MREVVIAQRKWTNDQSRYGSHIQEHAARVAIKMHNRFEKQDSIHWDAMFLQLSLDAALVWKPSCLAIARTSV